MSTTPAPALPSSVSQKLVVLRLVAAALALGVLLYLGMAAFLLTGGQFKPEPNALTKLPLVTISAWALLPGVLLVRGIVQYALDVESRRKLPPADEGVGPTGPGQAVPLAVQERLVGTFFVRVIVGCVTVEALGLFAVTAYLLENQPFALALGVLSILGLALQIPTLARFEAWVRRQMHAAAREAAARR